MSRLATLMAALALNLAASAPAQDRTWEINGVRLQPDQVERLATDMAQRTVEAVQTQVRGIELDPSQIDSMLAIYRSVSLGVYAEIVALVARDELDDGAKEQRTRQLVLDGQRRSHELLRDVLGPEQFERYAAWEQQQVAAFQSRRWSRRGRRQRR